jgi:hypothetical protein
VEEVRENRKKNQRKKQETKKNEEGKTIKEGRKLQRKNKKVGHKKERRNKDCLKGTKYTKREKIRLIITKKINKRKSNKTTVVA